MSWKLQLILAAALPSLIWLGLFRSRDKRPEPRVILLKTLCSGIIVAAPIVVYRFYAETHRSVDLEAFLSRHIESVTMVTILFFLVVALVEEYVKHVAMMHMVSRHRAEITQVVDGVVYAVSAAMGFALLENYVYLADAGSMGFFRSFLARAIGATLGHAVFSGVFGAFVGKAFFAPDIVSKDPAALRAFHRVLLKASGLHLLRTHVIPKRATRTEHSSGELMAEGYWVAVILHWVYDVSLVLLLFNRPIMGLAIFILVFGFAGLMTFMGKSDSQKVRRRAANILTIPEWVIPTYRARRARREMGLSEGL